MRARRAGLGYNDALVSRILDANDRDDIGDSRCCFVPARGR